MARPAARRHQPDGQVGYRPDIDGMRALAVMAVLFSHLRIPHFGGGYIGVDMFFVISGYVIYGDYLRRHAQGNFAIAGFLVRRARRLLPQLFLMCGAVLAAGAILLLPSDFARLPARIMSSATATSNWLFAIQSGYFAPAAEWNPLLHTWTLSVEIQFYFVFSVMLIAMAKWNEDLLPCCLVALFALSLAYCMLPDRPSAPFYDSGARAWEFLLGTLLHYARNVRWTHFSRVANSAAAGVAIATIAALIVWLPRDASFPDWRALIPTGCTAALILAVRQSIFSGVFESRPAVRLGQMSYAIYLWHWPVIVFATYVWPDASGITWKIAPVMGAILAISFVTFRFVEEPLRHPLTVTRATANRLIAIAFLSLSALCGAAWRANGWPGRLDTRTVQLDDAINDVNPRREACHLSKFRAARVANPCVYGAAIAPKFAFWSDSHGVELIEAITPWLDAHREAAAQFSFSSCAPTFPPTIRSDCDAFNKATFLKILRDPVIKTVVLAGATDDPAYEHNTRWIRGFKEAATALGRAGKRLVIVYPVPRQRIPGPRAMANFHRFSVSYRPIETPTSDYLRRTLDIFAAYDALGSQGVMRVYPHRVFCNGNRCAISDSSRPYYFDDNHLSLYGARRLVPALTLAMGKR